MRRIYQRLVNHSIINHRNRMFYTWYCSWEICRLLYLFQCRSPRLKVWTNGAVSTWFYRFTLSKERWKRAIIVWAYFWCDFSSFWSWGGLGVLSQRALSSIRNLGDWFAFWWLLFGYFGTLWELIFHYKVAYEIHLILVPILIHMV